MILLFLPICFRTTQNCKLPCKIFDSCIILIPLYFHLPFIFFLLLACIYTQSDTTEQLWFWQYDENKLYMDLDEDIRLRVIELQYSAEMHSKAGQDFSKVHSSAVQGDSSKSECPFTIVGTI